MSIVNQNGGINKANKTQNNKLYFYPICPISYQFNLLLNLSNIQYSQEQIFTRYQCQKVLDQFNITQLPIFVSEYGHVTTIVSMLIYLYKQKSYKLAEEWFNSILLQSFNNYLNAEIYYEVYRKTIFEQEEKILYVNNFSIYNTIIRDGKIKQELFCKKIDTILKYNHWIHEKFSINDLSVFSFLLSFDYCHHIHWYKFLYLKKWFCRIKSNPEYNFLLEYSLPNLNPSPHFKEFDF